MALRWRIRHKLMLGLVLVVGLMALLLGGTLIGLWSYYVTVNIVRAKLDQRRGADELKVCIAKLVEPQSLAEQRQYPNTDRKVQFVKDAIDEFGKKYIPGDEMPGGDAGEASDERGLLNVLRQNLAKFKDALDDEAKKVFNGDNDPDMTSESMARVSPLGVAGLVTDLAMPGTAQQLKLAAYRTSIWEKQENPVQHHS